MIRGKAKTYKLTYRKGYLSNCVNISIDAVLGFVMISGKVNMNCAVMTPMTSGTRRSKNNEGCQSNKMYTTNDTLMGSNTKTSANTNKTNRLKNRTTDSRSKLLPQ